MPLPPLARLQSRFLDDESHGCRPKAAQARWHSRVSSLVTWKLREYALLRIATQASAKAQDSRALGRPAHYHESNETEFDGSSHCYRHEGFCPGGSHARKTVPHGRPSSTPWVPRL
jgi:hypothetical protein